MGMFDTVTVPCPTCGTISEFQTKSGPCNLNMYALNSAPADVLTDVNRHAPNTCKECGTQFGIATKTVTTTLAVPVEWLNDFPYDRREDTLPTSTAVRDTKTPPTAAEVLTCSWWWNLPNGGGGKPHILHLDVQDGCIVHADDLGEQFNPNDWLGDWAPCYPPMEFAK
jgi:hypothetical protein